MRILLANPRGFCAGVNMAVQTLGRVLATYRNQEIYVYHEIVHNSCVVRQYAEMGVRFVESLGQVPNNAVLMFSAHGVSPQIRREAERKSLRVVDATCPLVSKVHRAVRCYAEQGYHVIYIGHPGHDEVVGTVGEAPEHMTVVSPENVERDLSQSGLLPGDTRSGNTGRKLACLMQTTLSFVQTRQIIEQLKQLFPEIEVPEGSVCYATQNRQEAVRQLAMQADFAIVVGSTNSSNSRRLREIAEQQGIPAKQVDGADEIGLHWFSGSETVMITAGASAPEHIVETCVRRLRENFDATTEEIVTCEENVVFPLPQPLAE
jgi:(E)-4-hydroxy-3-methyl-but-2-enyl pyrophosphate reductase (IPP and DMAPP forming)